MVSIPHAGTHVPGPIAEHLTDVGRSFPDTDWHVDRLYDFAEDLGASVLIATHSRYVIDVNRPPGGANLYPGRPTPELVPATTFAGEPLWRDGHTPDVAARRERYWKPYHDRLRSELDAIRERHGLALLWDAHSIRSEVPRLFEGALPDFSFGTGGGTSCAPERIEPVLAVARQSRYSTVRDGRFQGGWITRHYGRPADGIHAIQLELAQQSYMVEDETNAFDEDRAARLRTVLRALIEGFAGARR